MCKISEALQLAPQHVQAAARSLAMMCHSSDLTANFRLACHLAYGPGSDACAEGDVRLLLDQRLSEPPEYVVLALRTFSDGLRTARRA